MKIYEKAKYIVEKLNENGAELGNASWFIVEKALEEIEASEAAQHSVHLTGGTVPSNEPLSDYPGDTVKLGGRSTTRK